MERCSKCGHWTMSYSYQNEEWVCFCQYTIYRDGDGCHCNNTIKESRESYNERLRANNLNGSYSISPP